uniref:Uncharacterized protein n=1 Tax=Amphimedon queenslandica TaxID=400682 RepID=A0A1X7TNT1_AMPQE
MRTTRPGLHPTCVCLLLIMDMLLEFAGTKILIHALENTDLVSDFEDEIRNFESTATVSLQDTSSEYTLWKWSPKWDSLVAVACVYEIEDGDKSTVTPRPNVVSSV